MSESSPERSEPDALVCARIAQREAIIEMDLLRWRLEMEQGVDDD